MVVARGQIWWVDLQDPSGSEPGYRRPILIIQSNRFARSALNTLTVCIFTTNLELAEAPGNILVPHQESGLPKDSVLNVSQLYTIDKASLGEFVGELSPEYLFAVDQGLRLALDL